MIKRGFSYSANALERKQFGETKINAIHTFSHPRLDPQNKQEEKQGQTHYIE
ncbi:MAG: hypothetical protein KAW12_09090 [Candidatus Aminicenantes bacterium]|nr:hypothetical protein [Candidatus Aminicenantes bacterium]